MDYLITQVLQLDHQRQAVFRIALAQQVQPTLKTSSNYDYAVQAINVCWRWIESRDIDGMTIYRLIQDDEDYGVAPSMSSEHNPMMWNAWGCITEALSFTGSCAFESENMPPPEIFENAFPKELVAEFLGYYYAVVGMNRTPELLAIFLAGASEEQLTQSIVRTKVEEFTSTTATR